MKMIKGFFVNLPSEKKQPVSQSDTHHPLGGGKDDIF